MRVRHPLTLIVAGLAFVLLDFRTVSLDLLPDPVGWLLIALAARVLALSWVALGASVVAILSASEAFLPYRYRLINPLTNHPTDLCPPGEQCAERIVYDAVGGWQLAALAASFVLGAVVLVGLLRGLRRRAARDRDAPAAARLGLLTWSVALAWALPPVVAVLRRIGDRPVAYDAVWNGGAEYVALAGWVVIGWLAVELWFWNGRQWALRDSGLEPSPWAELMVRDRPPPRAY
jgi:hypothetical protein